MQPSTHAGAQASLDPAGVPSSSRPLVEAMELAKLGRWEWDVPSGTITWTDQAFRNLGYEPGEVVPSAETAMAHVHPDDVGRINEIVFAAHDGPYEFEHRVLHRDGSVNWIRCQNHPVYDEDGKLVRLYGATQDITDIKVASDNASWYAALVASSGEVIIGADPEGNIVTWNQGAADFYGYTADEMMGRPLSLLRAPVAEGQEHLRDVLERLAHGDAVSNYESQHLRKDGTLLEVSVAVSAIRDQNGHVMGSSAIVRDISSTKRTRESLELAVAQERLMVEKLTDLDRVRTSFVSSVSHELRTPLTSILGYLELLTDDPSGMNEHQQEMLDIVSRNSRRLFALIEDLLVLSRIESGAFKVLKEPVDVRALISAVAREVAPGIAAASHHLSVSIADEVGSVLGDPFELERLLQSLLSNAIKFTPTGGELMISASTSNDGMRIVVADSGLGIAEKDVEEVFNPFFRSAVADHRAIPGTGLGLPIAKTIVEQHGGTISCESELGRGTRMIVLLPYAIQERKAS